MLKTKFNNTLIPFISILLILILFDSCEKKMLNERNLESETTNEELTFEEKQYNEKVNTFTKVVSRSIKNQDFRKAVKNNALKMIDGDYDVIVKYVIDKPIKSEDGDKANYTIKELFKTNYSKTTTEKSSGEDYLNELLELYPDIQISVPVNCDDWDTENFEPIVGFIPAEFDEKTTHTITGYNSAGEQVEIDAVNPPNEPVLVIGLNERRIIDPNPDDPKPTPTPGTLSSTESGSSILLTWELSSQATTLNTQGYRIYRKAYNESSYKLVGTNYGMNNRTYFDSPADSQGHAFSYYVTAYHYETYDLIESSATNIVTETAPSGPGPVESFEAIQNSGSEIELRWTNGTDNVFEHSELYKKVLGVHNDYGLIGEFSHNTHYAFDRDLYQGKKVTYKINQIASNGNASDPKFDFVRVPYRDISQESNVYIDKISIGKLNEVERWISGKPEVEVTMAMVSTGDNPGVCDERQKRDYTFDSRTHSQTFNGYGPIITGWSADSWYQAVNIIVTEHDRSFGEITLTFYLKYKRKNEDKKALRYGGGLEYKLKIKNGDDQLGQDDYYYYQEENKWLEGFEYNTKVHLSNSSNYK